ncbi:MAG: tyrosine-type recombinase/integrase [Pirellulales bacterium]
MAWQDLADEFIKANLRRKPLAAVRSYESCIAAFTSAAEPANIGDIDVSMLENFLDARLQTGRRAATVNKELRHVKAVLRWAVRRKYLSEFPSFTGVFVREDRSTPVSVPQTTFHNMVKALVDPSLELKVRSAGWWRMFLYLAYYLGGRRGELLDLTWDQVSFERREVTIVSAKSKGRKTRTLPIARELAQLLHEWQDGGGTDSEVLPWPYATYRKLYEDWHAIQDAAGLPAELHYLPKNLRSACATELTTAGVPTAVVQQYLGHASIETTANYYVNADEAMHSAAEARAVVLNGAATEEAESKM